MTASARPHNGTPRCIALVGPYQSGKTSLLEALLFACGEIPRLGAVKAGTSLGDASAEGRSFAMGVEVNFARTHYLDDQFIFVDCPGSIEFLQQTLDALTGVDAAIVVAEPDPAKAAMLTPILHHLAEARIPHFIFVNKIDKATHRLREILVALQDVSGLPLILRQIPIWQSGVVTGYVDLATERAYVYREHAASEIIGQLPGDTEGRKKEARYQMLERLADYDDHLMEELLGDIEPPRDEIFEDLANDLRSGLIVPVMIGSAERTNGVRRLLKALRHEAPWIDETRKRLGFEDQGDALALALNVSHAGHGRSVAARILRGTIKDGATLNRPDGSQERIGGLAHMQGQTAIKAAEAHVGDLVAMGRLAKAHTGEILSLGAAAARDRMADLPSVHGVALAVPDAKDEVKATGAIAKLLEEDRSLKFEQRGDTHEMVLLGQGEVHLKVALARLKSRFGMTVSTTRPQVAYREAIRKSITQRGRHKRQSGGHGQFGDVVLDIHPRPRGDGSNFESRIVGGVVPKQFIPGVEAGVMDGLEKGPLGFPVVDVAVALTDGSYHSVDSSDMAFRLAARAALAEALPNCAPVLLEPIHHVEIAVPNSATARINGIISSRRGQILGFDTRPGWKGWDVVRAQIPEAELDGLIVEIRSASQGVGTFVTQFDHLAELTGKPAEHVLSTHRAA